MDRDEWRRVTREAKSAPGCDAKKQEGYHGGISRGNCAEESFDHGHMSSVTL